MSSLGSPNPFFIAGKKAYEVERSLRFNDDTDSAYLDRTPSGAGNRQVFTWSAWVKRGRISHRGEMISVGTSSSTSNNDIMSFRFDNSDEFCFAMYSSDVLVTTQKFRDPSAWYHIVVAVDTTQGTNTNRVKLYINGSQVTAFNTSNYPTQNYNFALNAALKTSIGRLEVNGDNYFSGYLAEIHSIDGSQLTPASFAETDVLTGEYKPKKYTGGYGTNGFYLNFSDNSGTTATTLGKDSSGNGNNFTPNNFATSDAVKDSPTNNFCTLDPNQGVFSATGTNTYSEGNLKVSTPSSGTGACAGNFGFTSGKWYAEVYVVANTGLNRAMVGVTGNRIDTIRNAGNWGENSGSGDVAYFGQNGKKHINSSETSYGDTYTVGDIVGVALDLDNRTVNFYKNNTAQGTISIGSTGDWIVGTGDTSGGAGSTVVMNFGQDSSFAGNKTAQGNADGNGKGDFYYSPPSGFVAMCSANFPDPTIKEPNQHFNTLLYTGNDSSDRDITGVGFQPDFLWIKNRSQADWHMLQDSIRGANKVLYSNTTDGEDTDNTNGHVNSFLADGFNVDAGAQGNVNENGENYVAWNWNAGGSTVTNNDGSVESQVRANTSAGFSIVTYTGNNASATVGHGLGVAPKFVMVKRRNGAGDWIIGHDGLASNAFANNKFLKFTSNSTFTNSLVWGSQPTSTVVQIVTGSGAGNLNGSSDTYVMYCFSEVAGYSKFGSYKGNGSSDGTFVFLGFKPAYVLVKDISSSYSWDLHDNKRDPDNVTEKSLAPNLSNAEDTYDAKDFLANGFKLRSSSNSLNKSGDTYIYLAFAESPFKYSRAR